MAILQQSPKLARHSRDPYPAASGYFGRVPEMSRLLGRLEEAAEGRGGVVLVAGEPGIGKSHALRQLIDRARISSTLVLAGRCVEGAGTPVPPVR